MQTIIKPLALAATAAALDIKSSAVYDVRDDTVPNDNCCRIYKQAGFLGRSRDFCTKNSGSRSEETVHDLTGKRLDNTMSSWKCGAMVAVRFCTQADGSQCQDPGNLHYGESAGGGAASEDTGIHDSLTQIVLMPYNPAERQAITVFN